MTNPAENLKKAIKTYDLKLAKQAIESGADINGFYEWFYTEESNTGSEKIGQLGPLLHAAVIESDLAGVRMLKALGADINALDSKRSTAAHYAALIPEELIMLTLIELGLDIMRSNSDNKKPIQIAFNKGNYSVVKVLHEKGATLLPSMRQIQTTIVPFDQLLPTIQFLKAIQINDPIRARLAMQRGASVDGSYPWSVEEGKYDNTGCYKHWTVEHYGPLIHQAARFGNNKAIRLLTTLGADINAVDEKGNTALHFAAEHNHDDFAETINLLLELHADTTLKNEDGLTPIAVTEKKGYTEFTTLMRESAEARKLLNPVPVYGVAFGAEKEKNNNNANNNNVDLEKGKTSFTPF